MTALIIFTLFYLILGIFSYLFDSIDFIFPRDNKVKYILFWPYWAVLICRKDERFFAKIVDKAGNKE